MMPKNAKYSSLRVNESPFAYEKSLLFQLSLGYVVNMLTRVKSRGNKNLYRPSPFTGE